jgi:hypothetical protein
MRAEREILRLRRDARRRFTAVVSNGVLRLLFASFRI